MNANTSPSTTRIALQASIDLFLWFVAVVLGLAVEIFVIVWVLRIPGQQARLGTNPGIWLIQFVQPLITIPLLTLVLRWRGERWSSLGLRQPNDWKRFFKQVAVAMLVLVVVMHAVRWLVLFPLGLRAPGFPSMQGNVPAFLGALTYALFGVGLNEELQFRGFVQSRIGKICGGGSAASYGSVVLTGLLFGLMHGAGGMAITVYASFGGIVLGALYLWTGRNLWVVVILHSLFDVVRVVQFFLTGNDLPT